MRNWKCLYLRVHVKTILKKVRVLNLRNSRDVKKWPTFYEIYKLYGQLKSSCDIECKIFRALCLYEYMGKDFKICISILLRKFISKFRITVHKNSSSYFHNSVFFVKSRLIFNVPYYRHTTQKFVHTKINTYSNESECIERLSYFTSMSVIKTCVTGLVLKDKNAQKLWKIFFIFLANLFNVPMIVCKNS